GDGTAKVSDITGGTSPGLVIQVSTTGNGPLDVLLPGSLWDVATKSTAAVTAGGARRLIDSVADSTTTQTVTFNTNQQAADGNSGNITFSTAEGIFIPGSATTAANAGTIAAAGIEQVAATTGVFQTLDKAAAGNQFWQGTDGRNGDTAVAALSDQMLQGAVRR